MGKSKWKDIDVSSLQDYNAETHRLTIESIQEALISLLRIKSINDVSVTELVQKAGVSRSAFYRNFRSIEEVLQSIVFDSFADLTEKLKMFKGKKTDAFWRSLVLSIVKHSEKVRSLITEDSWCGETLLSCMNDYFSDFASSFEESADLYEMRFYLGGIYNVILFWLSGGSNDTATELTDKIMKILLR